MTEVLTLPLKEQRAELAFSYKSLILGFPNLEIIPLNESIAENAAYFRANYNLPTPDAIYIATANSTSANGIICNDKKWKKIREIDVLVLDEFVDSG